ncbi:RNA-binding S4 domain-containing protein [Rhizobium paknamense]|uniref:Ribosome-associated heat shock protein Hsp15 n=1 Tax=Rhizobium paknamense TaxID=1206817 RepID=A0ABU0IH06_9HYPH|nr:RNA-binding S4 domain-containing protein [Rhizobium paknamense]MDQ0456680.1 ribosome-associated heat shock protein Hsp15 [Rhizobium paknamense]
MAEDQPLSSPQRIDKWLFFARISKSRTLAQEQIQSGLVQINGKVVKQPSAVVRLGDRLEIALPRRDLILKVLGPGSRRGPYEEARLLYEDLTPPETERPPLTALEQAQRLPGSGRPTKRERRQLDRLLDSDD